jgi:hypothetical protein
MLGLRRERTLEFNLPISTLIGTGISLFPALSQLVQSLQFSTQKHDKDAELKRQIDERMNGNMQLFDELQLVEY